MIVRPSELVEKLLTLGGQPLNIKDYPYLRDIYDSNASRVCLGTARQVSKCQWINDLATLADGQRKAMGELVAGDVLLGIDAAERAVPVTVTHVFPRTWKPGLRIRTRLGSVVTVSSDHRLRGSLSYRPGDTLAVGDRLAALRRGGVFNDRRQDPRRVRLTAYMIADGGLTDVQPGFTDSCPVVLADVRRLGAGMITRERASAGAQCIHFSATSELKGWLREDGLDGKLSCERHIPAWVFNLPFDQTVEFAACIAGCDATVTFNSTGFPEISYGSASEAVARGVRALWHKLGVTSSYHVYPSHLNGVRKLDAHKVRVEGREAVLRLQDVAWPVGRALLPLRDVEERSNRDTVPQDLAQQIVDAAYGSRQGRGTKGSLFEHGIRRTLKYPPSRLKWAKALDVIEDLTGADVSAHRALLTGDVIWDTIESIEHVGEVEMVDIEVSGEHNFILDGLVSHNSTTLASKLVLNAVMYANSRQVFICPLKGQTEEFALQRLRDFVDGSPIIRDVFFKGPRCVDQVYRKVFSANGSAIGLGYAQRSADRLRGQSVKDGTYIDPLTGLTAPGHGASIMMDEFQDILPDVPQIIEEMAFRALDPRFYYTGTPKSKANHFESIRSRSTDAEWAVRCPLMGCKKWNHTWTEKNIGDRGVICEFCGKPLDTRPGQWVVRRKLDVYKGKDARTTIEMYRIPQLIVQPIMSLPTKWIELLDKWRNYPSDRFLNEVLGLPADSSVSPITLDQLMACCHSDRRNEFPDTPDSRRPPLTIGVDWAFMGIDSYTFVVIGGWNPFPSKFDVYYWKIFKGTESDSLHQIKWIVDAYRRCNAKLICADWGAGHVQNLALMEALGEQNVMQVWHTGLQGSSGSRMSRAKWHAPSRKWHLARTRVLTDTFETLRRKQVGLPRAEECAELFDHLLAVQMEYNPKTNTQSYVNIDPDDGTHALTYAMLGAELINRGDFAGHAGSASMGTPSMADDWGMSADPDVDSLYGGQY